MQQKQIFQKKETGIGTSYFAKKIDLASLKIEINKFHIDKLKTTPADLSKLSNVINNESVKKTTCDKLVKTLMIFKP